MIESSEVEDGLVKNTSLLEREGDSVSRQVRYFAFVTVEQGRRGGESSDQVPYLPGIREDFIEVLREW